MNCTLEWSGINALLYYGPTLVESIGVRGNTVTLLVSGGIGIVQFLAVIPAIIFLDQWGVCSSFSCDATFFSVCFLKAVNRFSEVRISLLSGYFFAHCSEGGSAMMAVSHFLIAIFVSSIFRHRHLLSFLIDPFF
jgi:hypothetical protein